MEKVYVVLERWNTDCMDTDAQVFKTEKEAKAYADTEAKKMYGMIDDSVIKHEGDGDAPSWCYVSVEKEDGMDDEWYEAKILTRLVKGDSIDNISNV